MFNLPWNQMLSLGRTIIPIRRSHKCVTVPSIRKRKTMRGGVCRMVDKTDNNGNKTYTHPHTHVFSKETVKGNTARDQRLSQYVYNCGLQTMSPPSDDNAGWISHHCFLYIACNITNTIYPSRRLRLCLVIIGIRWPSWENNWFHLRGKQKCHCTTDTETKHNTHVQRSRPMARQSIH
jgi:hypothetical protein